MHRRKKIQRSWSWYFKEQCLNYTQFYQIALYLWNCNVLHYLVVPEASQGGFNHSMFEFYLEDRLLSIFAPRFDAEIMDELFDAMNFFYTNWPYIDDLEANRQAINKVRDQPVRL